MDLGINIETVGTTATVRLDGVCDLATAPDLKAAFQPLLPPDAQDVIVDVTALEFIDSTGLGVILGAMRKIREGGGSLKILGAAGTVRRVLEVTDLDKVIPMVDAETA